MTPPRTLQPCASLPQGLCAAGANPSFPSPYSRHSSTAGDRTAPRREAVSGVLRQRRCNCAGPWVESEMEELLPELPPAAFSQSPGPSLGCVCSFSSRRFAAFLSLREAKSEPCFADRSIWFCSEIYSRVFYFKFWTGQRTPDLVRVWRHFCNKNHNTFDKTRSVYKCETLHFSCISTVSLSLCQGIHPQVLSCPSPVLCAHVFQAQVSWHM